MSRFDWRAKGVPAAGFMLRVTSSAPKRRLKATWVSSSSPALRKSSTECSSKAALMAAHVWSSSGRAMSAPSIRAAKAGARRVTVIGVMGLWPPPEDVLQLPARNRVPHPGEPAALGHLAGALEEGGQGQAREGAAHADPLHPDRGELLDGEVRVRRAHHHVHRLRHRRDHG